MEHFVQADLPDAREIATSITMGYRYSSNSYDDHTHYFGRCALGSATKQSGTKYWFAKMRVTISHPSREIVDLWVGDELLPMIELAERHDPEMLHGKPEVDEQPATRAVSINHLMFHSNACLPSLALAMRLYGQHIPLDVPLVLRAIKDGISIGYLIEQAPRVADDHDGTYDRVREDVWSTVLVGAIDSLEEFCRFRTSGDHFQRMRAAAAVQDYRPVVAALEELVAQLLSSYTDHRAIESGDLAMMNAFGHFRDAIDDNDGIDYGVDMLADALHGLAMRDKSRLERPTDTPGALRPFARALIAVVEKYRLGTAYKGD